MKIVIFGLGSIGRKHAVVLKGMPGLDIYAFRSGINGKGNDLGIKEIFFWEEVNALKADAAFIANPTDFHIDTALKSAAAGMNLFIEKPLSVSMDKINELRGICRSKKLSCYTAYCLRFHPVIKELKKYAEGKKVLHARIVCASYLPGWRKGRKAKEFYSSHAAQGGGVLLDLSHEFDYVGYIFGEIKKMTGTFGRIGSVTVDSEDCADVTAVVENGASINIHLDYLSMKDERRVTAVFKNSTIEGDLLTGRVEIFEHGTKKAVQLNPDRNAYLREQAEYFIQNMDSGCIMNSLDESSKLLERILDLKNG